MAKTNSKAVKTERPGDPAARMVEISPGRYTLAPAGRHAPDVVMCRATPAGDGTWKLNPENVTWARIDAALLDAIGLGRQWDTLMRLHKAGFVEIAPIAPHTHLLNLDSWWNHIQRCVENPEFWDPGRGNREAYRRAL
jgi:hypothetical protein